MSEVRRFISDHGLFLDLVTDRGTAEREEGTSLLERLMDPEAQEADRQRQTGDAIDREQRQRERSERQ